MAPAATQVQLNWSASTDSGGSGLAGYRVYRNGSATPLATPTVNSYTDNSVAAGTAYSYRVSAVDAAAPANESALSAAANVTTPAAVVSGLDSRPANSSCLAGAEPTTTLAVTRAFPNLGFSAPVAMLQAPADASRWYVVEQSGRVRMFDNMASVAAVTMFIDISGRVASGGERGLLGMAFHPDFPTDRRVFLSYTTTDPGPLTSRISSFTLAGDNTTLDAGSERILLTVVQPESNHNGGNIAFGPDGYLYIGFGDGGGGGDGHGSIGNGQNLQTLLGKMLRIDVGGPAATSYAIPASNPFAGSGGTCSSGSTTAAQCREIYAWGFRNPWRWSFDRGGTHALWLGDVGQGAWEEVDRVVLGGNYGWRCREGAHDYNLGCGSLQPRLDPVAEYGRSAGYSITGGYVYRGTAIPSLAGRYVFADYGSGRIWNIAADSQPTVTVTGSQGLATGLGIASFGEAVNGELFVVDISGGSLYQLVQGAGGGGSVTTQFSATGCGASGNPAEPAPGLIPYAPNAGFWSDGASKARWLALPDGQDIETSAADHDWDFPNGTVLRKDFRIGARLVETRLFMRHTNGNWAGYSYEWNAAGTEATRVVGGKTVAISGQNWIFPSEAQCLGCHTAAAGRSLGLETAQLNGNLLYPATGRSANQVVTLNAIQVLSPPITAEPSALPAMPDPEGMSATLTERARAWLHTNCAFCHRPGGPTPSDMDLRYTTTLTATNSCNAQPQAGDLGLPNARIVAPGAPGSSVLLARIGQRNTAEAMPPFASNLVDAQGVQLISAWIGSLASCN
ncbi:MAG: PQQ-dependent sugar dehydrogenase [Gammaproteobacteria bacterium]|nr:PQQ-dependent sugar dehydrogenase [Gammaproteobacteria bacterium]